MPHFPDIRYRVNKEHIQMDETAAGVAIDATPDTAPTDGEQVADTPTETAAADTSAESSESTAAKTEEKSPDTEAVTEKPEIPEAARKEIGRMANALAKLQAENASLKANSVTKDAGPIDAKTETSAKADHPALAGLTPDDDGDYLVDGLYYSKADLIKKYDESRGYDELRERLDRMENAAENAKRDAEYNRTVAELNDKLSANVKDLRGQMFPDVPADKQTLFDNRLMRNVYAMIEEKTRSGSELNEELLVSAITDVFTEERELMGILGAAQVADNTKSKSQHPVAPGGIPGAAAPPDPLSMSQRAAESLADKAARLAESMRSK